jgi:hypothetical protein
MPKEVSRGRFTLLARASTLVIAGAACLASMPAIAQGDGAKADPQSQSQGGNERGLAEIVVTARKVEEDLQKTPIARRGCPTGWSTSSPMRRATRARWSGR